MRMQLMVALVGLGMTACTCGPGHPDGGNEDAGGENPDAAFAIQVIEPDGGEEQPVEAALLPGDGVAIAYWQRVDNRDDAGTYALEYREWRDGGVSAPERVTRVTRVAGLGLAVGPNGEPAVSYLGGDYPPPLQAFWFQNDAYLSYRTGGTWNTTVVAMLSNETGPSNPVSDNGWLVGIQSAIAFDGSTVYVAWRDCHNGQFGTQDYRGSDLEAARGSLTSFPEKRVVIDSDGLTVGKKGYGGDSRMIIVNGEPVIVGDQKEDGWDVPGRNVLFYRRNADGSWTAPADVMSGWYVPDTQLGPSIAYDPVLGYAVAVTDATQSELSFTRSSDGVTWDVPVPVVNAGTSGWYPSIAVDPDTHEPNIAYYHCDPMSGRNKTDCRALYDELRIIYRVAGTTTTWRNRSVDPAGGWGPTLMFLSTGKRAVVYRDPRTYAVKIAVEP